MTDSKHTPVKNMADAFPELTRAGVSDLALNAQTEVARLRKTNTALEEAGEAVLASMNDGDGRQLTAFDWINSKAAADAFNQLRAAISRAKAGA